MNCLTIPQLTSQVRTQRGIMFKVNYTHRYPNYFVFMIETSFSIQSKLSGLLVEISSEIKFLDRYSDYSELHCG